VTAGASTTWERRPSSAPKDVVRDDQPPGLENFMGFANPAPGSAVGYDPMADASIRHLPFVRGEEAVVGVDSNIDFVDGVYSHVAPGEKPVVEEVTLDCQRTTSASVTVVVGAIIGIPSASSSGGAVKRIRAGHQRRPP
jgi:hypothetical protein